MTFCRLGANIPFLMFPAFLNGQDTIFLHSGFKTVAIIKEVMANEIMYVKYKRPNGLVFYEDKKNIRVIKYANGLVDSIVIAPSFTPEKISLEYDSTEKIYVKNFGLVYKGTVIKDRELKQLLQNYPEPHKNFDLLLAYQAMRKMQKKRYLFTSLGAFSTFLALEAYAIFAPYKGDNSRFIVPAIFGGGTAICAFYGRKNKYKAIKKKKEIADAYNK